MTQPIHLTEGDFSLHSVSSEHVFLHIRLPGKDQPLDGYLVSVPRPDVQKLIAQLQSAVPQPKSE